MRKLTTIVILLLSVLLVFAPSRILSQGGVTAVSGGQSELQGDSVQSELIDIKANIVYPYKIDDSTSVLCLVGDFAAQHNGAVITADSAVRYEDDRVECFGNVLINKNTTYAYCDRIIYSGETNEAMLFAPLIKVIDEDVTMYAYNFKFNTESNTGEYWGSGVTVRLAIDEEAQEAGEERWIEDVLESQRGFYYADTKEVVGVDEVELSGDKYEMRSDSTIYDMQNEQAYFFENTNIWNEGGEYLFGDRGDYVKSLQLFRIERGGYILTKEQEAWADTMNYYREHEEAIMRGNIQMDDTTHKSSAFSDFAHYWGEDSRVMLTCEPVLLNYDNTQQRRDSVTLEPAPVDTIFMRADTIILVTKRYEFDAESEEGQNGEVVESESEDQGVVDDVEGAETDSLAVDSLAVDTLDAPKKRAKRAKKVKPVKDTSERDLKRAQKVAEREQKMLVQLRAEQVREHRRLTEKAAKVEKRMDSRRAKGRDIYTDSMILIDLRYDIAHLSDSLSGESMVVDSLLTANSLVVDSTMLDSSSSRSEVTADSTYRLVTAMQSVKSYRSDLQFICDSLSGNTADSLMQLFYDPVVWSGTNQILSEQMNLYIYNGELDYAHFVGDPISAAQILADDTTHFNQIKGKDMYAYFVNNEVVRNDVESNVQTIYFMQDEESGVPTTYSYIESGTATFLIEDRHLDGMIYRSNPTYTFAPLDKMPSNKSLYLDGFKWRNSERPTRETIFDRQIRESQRVRVDSLERPQFPIRAKIDEERQRLQREGVWRDRTDKVSPAATEWMKSLGFTPGMKRAEESSSL